MEQVRVGKAAGPAGDGDRAVVDSGQALQQGSGQVLRQGSGQAHGLEAAKDKGEAGAFRALAEARGAGGQGMVGGL